MSIGIPSVAPALFTLPLGDAARWQGSLDTNELKRHVDWCRATPLNTTDKGNRLENLVCWLFSHIPGFTAERTNVFSEDGAQEFDVLFWNSQDPNGFPSFGNRIMAECKNWERPVDSSDVAWFDWKMRLGGVQEGLLIAANGITTRASRREAAVGILSAANADALPRRIHVLTLEDCETLTSVDDLTRLIKLKSLGLAARAPFD